MQFMVLSRRLTERFSDLEFEGLDNLLRRIGVGSFDQETRARKICPKPDLTYYRICVQRLYAVSFCRDQFTDGVLEALRIHGHSTDALSRFHTESNLIVHRASCGEGNPEVHRQPAFY